MAIASIALQGCSSSTPEANDVPRAKQPSAEEIRSIGEAAEGKADGVSQDLYRCVKRSSWVKVILRERVGGAFYELMVSETEPERSTSGSWKLAESGGVLCGTRSDDWTSGVVCLFYAEQGEVYDGDIEDPYLGEFQGRVAEKLRGWIGEADPQRSGPGRAFQCARRDGQSTTRCRVHDRACGLWENSARARTVLDFVNGDVTGDLAEVVEPEVAGSISAYGERIDTVGELVSIDGVSAQSCRKFGAFPWQNCPENRGPVAETCNGKDDDCSGRVDDGVTRKCSLQEGVCRGATATCTEGSWNRCDASNYGDAYEPDEQSTGDGKDNDCDGEVDEETAADPEPEQKQRITATDRREGHMFFGTSIDVEGDRAVIGAWGANQAYIYNRLNGTWNETQVLGDEPGLDRLGWSVAIDGDTIAVGAPRERRGDDQKVGMVRIYTRGSDGTWSGQRRLRPDDLSEYARFGGGLALEGDTLLVGAYNDETNISRDGRGSVYVYERDGTNWTRRQKFHPERETGARGGFGRSIELEGDVALIGAPWERHERFSEREGAAYLYERNGSGEWIQRKRFVSPEPQENGEFGTSIALEGNTVFVGANYEDHGGYQKEDHGAAYVFTRSGGSWSDATRLMSPNAREDGLFGSRVAARGDVALISAVGEDAVYLFTRGAQGWSYDSKLVKTSEYGDADSYGTALALGDGRAMVGADTETAYRWGAAYCFRF